MNARTLVQAGLVAALFAAGAAAQASPFGEGDTLSAQPLQVQSNRSFSQAQAASLTSARGANISGEAYGENVHTAGASSVDRQAVRAAAIQAQRSGELDLGDATSF